MPIFQDPIGSLDKRWPIWRSLTEPLLAKNGDGRFSIAERRIQARDALSEVGLGHLDIESRPASLSVGQCQRVSIARALVAKPTLILADEPTSALDASVSASVLQMLAGAAERGSAILIVSHDESMLACLCDRVASMKDGIIKA
jgi:peptide/nickel transport system ATP-binding protein